VALFKANYGATGSRRVRFLVIGDGHLRRNLEDQALALGLGADVRFLGMRSDPEDFYPALDVMALTSRNEGTPLTLIEAMANSRAVIATNVGGVVDLLGRPVAQSRGQDLGYAVCERGVLVRPDDAPAFCAGLIRLIEDGDLRRDLGEAARLFIERNYAKERLVGDIDALYRELLAPEGTGGQRTQPHATSGQKESR
jgi:glycosyltransferase involved in cell wall biosynthesis